MANSGQRSDHGRGQMRELDGPQPHYLRPVASSSIPHSLAFVDCESNREFLPDGTSERQSLRLGVAIGVRREAGAWVRRDTLKFFDSFEFWLWAVGRCAPKKPLWIFCHNAAVDLTWIGLWDRIDDGTLKISSPCPACGGFKKGACQTHTPFRGACVVSDPPIILTLRCSRGIIRIVDTMNYWKTSVTKLGRGINYPKIAVLGERPTNHELFQYCEVDCEIIEKSVCGLLEEWEREDCGHFVATAAGLSWAAFRKFLPEKTLLVNHEEPHTSLERAAYYGGQAEAYYIGKRQDDCYLLDVRSLYPSVMAGRYYPVKFAGMGKDLDIAHIKTRCLLDQCIASCVVRTEGAGYPVRLRPETDRVTTQQSITLMGRQRWKSERLGFAVGHFHTYLATPELLRAIERNELMEVYSIAWYRSAKIFDQFVEHWFSRRPRVRSAETFARDLLCKTILNSLSGYFAKHKMRWMDQPGLMARQAWGEWNEWSVERQELQKFRSIGGHVQAMEEGGESRDSMPAISAHITSYGREQMLWIREHCREQSILYQDTDGLIVTEDGYLDLQTAGLIGNGELGRLQMVGKLPELQIHQVKDYEWKGGRRTAGIREAAIRTGPATYRQEAWESIAEQWSRTPDNTVYVTQRLIALTRRYLTRTAAAGGWTLPPRLTLRETVPF